MKVGIGARLCAGFVALLAGIGGVTHCPWWDACAASIARGAASAAFFVSLVALYELVCVVGMWSGIIITGDGIAAFVASRPPNKVSPRKMR